jgi:hypothetical protein
VNTPYTKFVPVTPSATTFQPTQAIIVAVGGTLTVTDRNGNSVALTVPAGELHMQVVAITAASATGLTLCY